MKCSNYIVSFLQTFKLFENETFDNKKREMPRIIDSDPVARYFGAKIGDIFEITRPSVTTGEAISYRIVVQGNLNFLNY